MSSSKTGIEYLDRLWNFYPGCNHGPDICPVSAKCWARGMAHRFKRSFEPQLIPEMLTDPLHYRKPDRARIGVCFTGDLGGDWVDPEERVYCERFENQDYFTLKDNIFMTMEETPQHTYFVLTKRLDNLVKWGKWPDNAIVGGTVCSNGMMTKVMTNLATLDAKYKLISFEPTMGRIGMNDHMKLKDAGVSWITVGGWSGGKTPPRIDWIREIVDAADESGIPVFLKDNLKPLFKNESFPEMTLRQQLPEVK